MKVLVNNKLDANERNLTNLVLDVSLILGNGRIKVFVPAPWQSRLGRNIELSYISVAFLELSKKEFTVVIANASPATSDLGINIEAALIAWQDGREEEFVQTFLDHDDNPDSREMVKRMLRWGLYEQLQRYRKQGQVMTLGELKSLRVGQDARIKYLGKSGELRHDGVMTLTHKDNDELCFDGDVPIPIHKIKTGDETVLEDVNNSGWTYTIKHK